MIDMHSLAYSVTLTPAQTYAANETGFVVTFADFPEAITQGQDEADALIQAADALEEAIAARMKHGEAIPLPTRQTGPLVAVPLQTALKAALYIALRGERGRQSALAERIGKDEKEVRRLLYPHHRSRPKSVEQALRALGKRVTVVLGDVG
jgi:antitoxin HicB